jgi:hypothetical protein
VSSQSLMVKPRQVLRALVFALLLPLLSAASVSLAYGQDFSLTPSMLSPPSVDPGGSSTATINLGATGGFDNSVSLSCAVTSSQVTSSMPVCAVSPTSQIPPANGPALTITTTDSTPAGLYTITVTGVSGSLMHTTTPLSLNVVDITEDYSLAVSPATATPNPVGAGNSATTTVTVTPIGSYGNNNPPHQVTLACFSISPAVAAAPYCSFDPPTVTVTSGIPPTSAMTITTLGPVPTTKLRTRRIFYALWLAIPGLALVGVGATGRSRKNFLGALLLLAIGVGVLLMPACNSTTTTNSPNGEVTPNNTYTFTLTAADENGAGPSNNPAPSGTTQPPGVATVAVTVTTSTN